MALNHAWLIKGWLLGQTVPSEIVLAIDAVIAGLSSPAPDLKESETMERVLPEPDPMEQTKPPKKKRAWSEEARAAAAERLRDRRQSGLLKRKAPTDPGEAILLSEGSTGSME